MTVAQLTDSMSFREFARWAQFYEERERDRVRRQNKAAGRVDFSDPNAAEDIIDLVNAGGTKG